MSRSGEVTVDWGGEPERVLRLGIGQIRKLQESIDAGPLGISAMCQVSLAVLAYQNARDWVSLSMLDLSRVAEKTHVREAIKQGLLGAGVDMVSADKLVREYVDERPLAENLVTTIQLCMAAVYGVEEERSAGESEAVEGSASQPSPTASSGSEKTGSTPSEPPAGSPPGMSTQ
jgi:hypothetical protein